MTRTTWARLGALMLMLALLLAACNGGDGDSNGDGTSTSGSSSGSGSDDSGSDSGGLGNAAAALANADCREYMQAFGGLDSSVSDPGRIQTMQDVADFLTEVADEVPNEISDDFRVVARAYQEFAAAMGDFDFSDPTAMAQMSPEALEGLQEASANLDTEEFEQAVNNISEFLEENCT